MRLCSDELRFFAVLSLIAVLFACASPSGGNMRRTTETTGSVLLTVQNDNYSDATIYANWGGARDRLGFVVGKTTQTFTFNWRREDIRLEAAFIPDGGWRTHTVLVYPSDHLDLTILPGPTGRDVPGAFHHN